MSESKRIARHIQMYSPVRAPCLSSLVPLPASERKELLKIKTYFY